MIGYRCQGPVLTLFPQDKESLERHETLECKLTGTEITATLELRPEVVHGPLEEPGFHLVPYPDNAYDTLKKYEITINPQVLERIVQEGCFISRCIVDRATIRHYDFASMDLHG
jgi:hypothetical protein